MELLPFVFSGSGGKEPVSGFSRAKATLDKRVAAICKAPGRSALDAGTVHDPRRTMVTGMNELGIAPLVVEAVVNHVSGAAKAGVAGVYNRALSAGTPGSPECVGGSRQEARAADAAIKLGPIVTRIHPVLRGSLPR